MYELPDDRSEVEVAVVDALSAQPVPWAVVEVCILTYYYSVCVGVYGCV